MGVIQGSINNLLTTAGVAARLSPSLEERRKVIGLRQQQKALENVAETQQEATGPASESSEANKLYAETLQKKADVSQQIFEAKPSQETYTDTLAEKQGQNEFNQIIEQAQTKLLQEQERARRSEQFRQMFTEGGRYK